MLLLLLLSNLLLLSLLLLKFLLLSVVTVINHYQLSLNVTVTVTFSVKVSVTFTITVEASVTFAVTARVSVTVCCNCLLSRSLHMCFVRILKIHPQVSEILSLKNQRLFSYKKQQYEALPVRSRSNWYLWWGRFAFSRFVGCYKGCGDNSEWFILG